MSKNVNKNMNKVASKPKLPIIDLSALSWHNQVEELFFRIFLKRVWFPDCETSEVQFKGLQKGVGQEVDSKMWQYGQFWLAA